MFALQFAFFLAMFAWQFQVLSGRGWHIFGIGGFITNLCAVLL
jgi:hypothetical protein